jgi:hypothetical protein
MPTLDEPPIATPAGQVPINEGMIPLTKGKPGAGLTPGQQAVDNKYAADFQEWTAGGGFADVDKQIQQLEEAAQALESRDDLTGPIRGNVPDYVRAVTNPDAIAVREAVEEVVQRNLRLVLGAQFTEKEGDRLIARAFNPRLDEKENAKRVRRLMTQIKDAAKAKQAAAEYFAQNGTLAGWQGKIPTFSDFNPDGDDGAAADPLGLR